MLELYQGVSRGILEFTQEPRPETTGRTTFAAFAREIVAPALRGQPAPR
jgi:hypothetical protein